MYETAHARTHGVEEEYLSLKGAMGNARLSGRAVGHDGRSCSVLSCRKGEDRVCLLDREKESSVWCRFRVWYHTEFPIEFPKSNRQIFSVNFVNFQIFCQLFVHSWLNFFYIPHFSEWSGNVFDYQNF